MVSHYVQGLLITATYLVAYAWQPEWFLHNWRAVYFGYYIYEVGVLIVFWERLLSSFRVFYAVHHTVSFVITGLWMLVGGEWLGYITLGVVIWLTSDVWLYTLSLYRLVGRAKPERGVMARWQVYVFVLERAHRAMAYIVPMWLANFSLSPLALVVLGTGLANDVLDASFQWKALRRRRRG